jgi:GT2 family glycosyltransferase
MQLSIVVVNYNVKHFLEQCLASVRRAVVGLQAEVWVADNASSDESLAYLRPLFPEVHFVPLPQNIGFARGNNAVLPHCKGRYILFLNPDTIVAEDSLHKAMAYMDAHPNAGALGVKMIDGSGGYLPESKRGFPSPATSLYKQLGLHRWFPKSKTFARYYLGHLSPNQNQVVDVLAGAFMLVRKKVLDEVGGFDEQFFMYGEDIDLSYRITKAGYTNHYFAHTTILHFKGESAGQMGFRYNRVFYQAMQLFVKKHFSGSGTVAFRLLLYAGIVIRAWAGLVQRLISMAQKPLSHQETDPLPFSVKGWPEDRVIPPALCDAHRRIGIATQTQSRNHLLAFGHSLSAAEAIAWMEKNGAKYNYWLHAVKTNSVVSSGQRKRLGKSYAFCK